MRERRGRRWLWRNYSLSIVLVGLWLGCWALQWWLEVPQDANSLDARPVVQWLAHSFENLQSEFAQLFTFVTLTSFLIHRGSPESKDSDEEVRAYLQRIEGRLRAMAQTERQYREDR